MEIKNLKIQKFTKMRKMKFKYKNETYHIELSISLARLLNPGFFLISSLLRRIPENRNKGLRKKKFENVFDL